MYKKKQKSKIVPHVYRIDITENKPTDNSAFVALTNNDARSTVEEVFSLVNVDDHSVHHHNLFIFNVFYTSLKSKYPVNTARRFIDVLFVHASNPVSEDEFRWYMPQKSVHSLHVVFSSNNNISEIENIYK